MKLVIRGGAPLRGQDHLRDIARFIDRLENNADFMGDFRQVTFEGAESILGGEEPIATFEIHAWHDQNKRRNSGRSASRRGPDGLIGTMQDNIRSREEMRESVISVPSGPPRN